MTGCTIADLFELADQLPEVVRSDNGRYWRITVGDKTFGYLWEPTRTVGLKQTIAEQLALVAERPETFEVQFTSARLRLGRGQAGRGRARRAGRAHLRGVAADRTGRADRPPRRPPTPLTQV